MEEWLKITTRASSTNTAITSQWCWPSENEIGIWLHDKWYFLPRSCDLALEVIRTHKGLKDRNKPIGISVSVSDILRGITPRYVYDGEVPEEPQKPSLEEYEKIESFGEF